MKGNNDKCRVLLGTEETVEINIGSVVQINSKCENPSGIKSD